MHIMYEQRWNTFQCGKIYFNGKTWPFPPKKEGESLKNVYKKAKKKLKPLPIPICLHEFVFTITIKTVLLSIVIAVSRLYDPQRHILKAGLDPGLWTLDSGLWTLDSGLFLPKLYLPPLKKTSISPPTKLPSPPKNSFPQIKNSATSDFF